MKLDVNGQEVSLGFHYYEAEFNGKVLDVTAAVLEKIIPVEGDIPEREMIGYGESYCHPSDQFKKATGRKLALRRLLSRVFPGEQGKKQREEIWKQIWEKGMRRE